MKTRGMEGRTALDVQGNSHNGNSVKPKRFGFVAESRTWLLTRGASGYADRTPRGSVHGAQYIRVVIVATQGMCRLNNLPPLRRCRKFHMGLCVLFIALCVCF